MKDYPFSNFLPYTHNPLYEGIIIKTPEHYYQAEKAFYTEDKIRILECETPGKAKRLAAKVTLRDDWEKVKTQVMYRAQMLKALNDPDYAELICNSSPKDFIEYNHWHDNEWGSCVCENCKDKPKKNLLQKVLMNIQRHLIFNQQI